MFDTGGVYGVPPCVERVAAVCAGDVVEAGDNTESGQSGDWDRMRRQTEMWCMHLPNEKKNIQKMKMVFVDGYAKFIPK